MAKFEIRYGLGGGFGGPGDWEEIDADNVDEAIDWAYESACNEYESYDGMHGLSSYDDIAEENPDWGEEEVEDAWRDERETWLTYEAREVKI